MNKLLFTAAALSLAGTTAAHAQTLVQIYGNIDAAFERLTNVNSSPPGMVPRGGSVTRMPHLTGGQLPSRIGFRGTEDIGNGVKAVFTLENGFATDSGALGQGGRLFGRQAFIGLSGSWGALTVGRQSTMLTSGMIGIDIIGPAAFSTGALDPYIPSSLADNSIAYKGTFSGVTVGATYSLGRDTVTSGGPAGTGCLGESSVDARSCRNWSTLFRYDAANYGVAMSYDRYNGGNTSPQPGLVPGIGGAFGPTNSRLADRRLNMGGYVKFSRARVGAGLLRRINDGDVVNPRTDMYYMTAGYTVTPAFVVDSQLVHMDAKSSPLAANDANDTNLLVLRGTYSLSKRTAVYALIGRADNKGVAARTLSAGMNTVPGGGQNGIMTGIRHFF